MPELELPPMPKRGERIEGLQYRTVVLQRSAFSEEGDFEGLASAFGVEDAYGTKWAKGAWTAGGLKPDDEFALLWMHDSFEPVATFRAEEREDGLWIIGKYDPTPEGQRARLRAMSGSAPELSVGFYVLTVNPDDTTEFTATKLVETSQITKNFAAQPGAGMSEVRVKNESESAGALRRRRARAAAASLALTDVLSLGK